ncbi:hypothetical protein BpHYR1_053725 [Brachionus plicatilis]|uniref:Uncharacterized protein n=1 Tax=Brachionus plicatilis TaxID=10195 RepID=A0A3M7Q3H3_BRAPC|nr:hypothetical protein BpHYR1_053725 [Brachionus plicatilis]
MQSAHYLNDAILILVSFDHFEHQKLIINFNLPYCDQALITVKTFIDLIQLKVNRESLIHLIVFLILTKHKHDILIKIDMAFTDRKKLKN